MKRADVIFNVMIVVIVVLLLVSGVVWIEMGKEIGG